MFAICCHIWPIVGNMTSLTKPEVHNVFNYHQRRTEPRSQVTRAGNFAKFGLWFLRYASGQTGRHTDTLIAILRTPTASEITRKHAVEPTHPLRHTEIGTASLPTSSRCLCNTDRCTSTAADVHGGPVRREAQQSQCTAELTTDWYLDFHPDRFQNLIKSFLA